MQSRHEAAGNNDRKADKTFEDPAVIAQKNCALVVRERRLPGLEADIEKPVEATEVVRADIARRTSKNAVGLRCRERNHSARVGPHKEAVDFSGRGSGQYGDLPSRENHAVDRDLRGRTPRASQRPGDIVAEPWLVVNFQKGIVERDVTRARIPEFKVVVDGNFICGTGI